MALSQWVGAPWEEGTLDKSPGRSHDKTEAETRVVQLQAWDTWAPASWERQKNPPWSHTLTPDGWSPEPGRNK